MGDTASVEDLPIPSRYTHSCFYGAFCLCTEVFSPSHEWIVAGPVRNVITPLDNTKNGEGCLALSGLPQEPCGLDGNNGLKLQLANDNRQIKTACLEIIADMLF